MAQASNLPICKDQVLRPEGILSVPVIQNFQFSERKLHGTAHFPNRGHIILHRTPLELGDA